MNEIISVKPEFGVNYKVGYIGFTFTDNNFVSNGIAWFTRWDKGKNPDVPTLNLSHNFIVSNENECIEATTPSVCFSPLTKYFDNPHTHVCFRKPLGMTELTGHLMALDASHQLGKPYDYSLIAGHALSDTLVGKLLEEITDEKSRIFLTWLFENKKRFICSELVAMVMRNRPEYCGKGVLVYPPYSIDPQQLFQDHEIFAPWAEQIQGTKI